MFNCQLSSIAEEEGFEPPVRFPVQRFSRPPVSTAHPFLRLREYYLGYGEFQVLDRKVLSAIRFLRAESYRSRYGVGMFDGDDAVFRSSFDRKKVAPLGLHVELFAIPERDLQRKRLACAVRSEVDFRDGPYRHLAMKTALAIKQHCVAVTAVNEPAKLRVSDRDLRTILQANKHDLHGRRRLRRLQRLQEQSQNKIQNQHHSLSIPRAMPIPPLMHSVASP